MKTSIPQLLHPAFQGQALYSLPPSSHSRVALGWAREMPQTPLLKCSGVLWSWGVRVEYRWGKERGFVYT